MPPRGGGLVLLKLRSFGNLKKEFSCDDNDEGCEFMVDYIALSYINYDGDDSGIRFDPKCAEFEMWCEAEKHEKLLLNRRHSETYIQPLKVGLSDIMSWCLIPTN